jgi:hypothetical protein
MVRIEKAQLIGKNSGEVYDILTVQRLNLERLREKEHDVRQKIAITEANIIIAEQAYKNITDRQIIDSIDFKHPYVGEPNVSEFQL